MKFKVILFCVLLFCSKIVDSVPHSENHVRQRVNLLSNWQVNKNVPNAQYLDTDFTQTRNVNKLTNSAIQQENNEDYYSNQRGYNYDSYGYNKSPASSASSKDLLVNYDLPADGRRLDSYPPRAESYPSHISQVGFEDQQYRNQKRRSQNPFTNSVPSSVFITNDETPLVNSVQEPYRGLAQYVQPKYVPSLNQPSYQPGRSYLTREQLQYSSVDHSGDNKYVVNPATRYGSKGLVPYENYSESQASETKTRPTGVRIHVQNFETPSKTNYETLAVESPDTLVDQSENIRYPVPYENYREGQVSKTKTRPTGVRRQVQNFETPSEIKYVTSAVESPDTLVDQSENIRYPVPYENYREGQVSETKIRPTGVRRHVQNFDTPSEIKYVTSAVESPDTLVDQSENIRYPVPYENYREGQVSETKTRQTGVRRHVQNFETPSEIKYVTSAVESPDTLVDQSENIRHPVPYKNYRESQVSETKTRLTGVRRHLQDFETPPEIKYVTSAVESPDTLVDQSENIRYPVPYENYREGLVSETKTRLTGVRRHLQDFETPPEINYETPAVESLDTLAGQSENIRYVEKSRLGSHLSNSAPITSHDGTAVSSETDNYSSDSRPSKLAPVVNVKKEATVEMSKVLADKPLAHKYGHRSDYGWSDNSDNDSPIDITETVEVKEGKYGTNYAEEKAVSINTYPEDSLTPTDIVLESSGSIEESNVPQNGSSSSNTSKQNAVYHLTSEIKELSLKSLVANPEIQHILSRTDKRYVVVHSNGTIEYLDTLPLDSHQDSKFRLVHSKRKNIDGSEGDEVVTPQWPHNLPSNTANTPAVVDEYPWVTNNQPAEEYDSHRVILFENLPAGHSHLKPLLPHGAKPVDNENSGALPPPVNQSADGGYSKPLIPNEDQPVDDSNSYQPKDDGNLKSLAPNEAQPVYDDILKHWTLPKNQPREDGSSKPLFMDANQSKDKINLTPYARNPVHVKRHKHAYVTHSANDNTFKPLLPKETQPRDERNSELAHPTQPAHDTKPKPSNQPENDDNSNPSTPNKNQPTDDTNSEPLNENLTRDDIVSKLLHPYYKHHKILKHSNVNEPVDGNNSNPSSTPKPLDYPDNQSGDDNPAKSLSSNENQAGDNKKSKLTDKNKNQTRGDNDSELLASHKRHPAHHHKSKYFYGNHQEYDDKSNSALENKPGDDNAAELLPSNEDDKQPEDDKSDKPQKLNENQSEGDIDSEPLLPHKKPRAHHNKAKPKHSHVNLESDDDNSNSSSQNENQPGDDNAAELLPSNKDGKQPEDDKSDKPPKFNENQSEGDIDSEPLLPHIKTRARHNKAKPKHSHVNPESDDDNSNSSSQHENQPGDDNAAKPLPSNKDGKQPKVDKSNRPQKLNENQSEGDIDSKPLSPHKKPRVNHNKPQPKHSNVNLESDDDNSNLSSLHENQPGDETDSTPSPPHNKPRAHHKKPKYSHLNQPAYDDNSKLLPSPVNQAGEDNNHNSPKPSYGNEPADDNNSKQPSSDENQPEDEKKSKSLKPLPGNQPADDNNIKSPPSYENQPASYKTPKQSADETESTPSPHKIQQPHHNKSQPKHSQHVNQPADNNTSPETQPEDIMSKPLPTQTTQSKHSRGNQPANDSTSKPLTSNEIDIFPDKIPENDDSSKPSLLPENTSEDDNDFKPLPPNKRQPVHRNKSKHSNVNKPANDNNSNPASLEKNQLAEDNGSKPLPSNADQSEEETDSTPSLSHKIQPGHHKKPKRLHVNLESNDNNANPSSQDENQQRDDKADENHSGDETVTSPLSRHKKQRAHHKKPKYSDVNKSVNNNSKTSPDETKPKADKKSKSLSTSENQSKNDNNSKSSPPEENQSENDMKFKPLPAYKNKPNDGLNSKLTPSVSNNNDDKSKSRTLSPTVPYYTTTPKPQAIKQHKHKHSHRKTTSNSPVVSTTPSPDDSSEDQIITLSLIGQVTDNVSNVPTLTTTAAKPVETPDKQGTYIDANNKPYEVHDDTKSSSEDLANTSDEVQTSTTTATPSSSTSPRDNASSDKTKGQSVKNQNKAVLSKENNRKDNRQTVQSAVNNSSELLDTNTDVSEETDDYLPVTPSLSVQNDVDTGDASGDNLSESETDVTITVSSTTTYNSEDEIITINIEVSESTDDADSPSNDKTLVVSIDTNRENDDDSKALQTDVSKTTKTEDCNEEHNHGDGRGKNVEIDLSNLKGEPTMWIKTTNQDLIDKLTEKNDTQVDVIYFFSIENQPTVEREKETTIFCNGTVVIETTEITHAHKDDPTPTIVKTKEIMQIEDYED